MIRNLGKPFRALFVSCRTLHYYLSYVQTVVGDFMLKIDIVAENPEQLNKIADTLRTLEIEDSE